MMMLRNILQSPYKIDNLPSKGIIYPPKVAIPPPKVKFPPKTDHIPKPPIMGELGLGLHNICHSALPKHVFSLSIECNGSIGVFEECLKEG